MEVSVGGVPGGNSPHPPVAQRGRGCHDTPGLTTEQPVPLGTAPRSQQRLTHSGLTVVSQDPVPLYLGAGRTVRRVVTWEAAGRRCERLPPESSCGLPRCVRAPRSSPELELNYLQECAEDYCLMLGKRLGYKCQV